MSNAVLYGRGNLPRAVTYYLPRNLLRELSRGRVTRRQHMYVVIFSRLYNNLRAVPERGKKCRFSEIGFFRHITPLVLHIPEGGRGRRRREGEFILRRENRLHRERESRADSREKVSLRPSRASCRALKFRGLPTRDHGNVQTRPPSLPASLSARRFSNARYLAIHPI